MARGALSGAIWGVVVAGIGAGTASVVTGPVMAPKPNAVAVEPAVAVPAAPAADGVPSARPEGPSTGAETTSPGVPDQPDQSAGVGVDTQSAPVPQTGDVTANPQAPAAPGAADVAVSEEEGVLPNPQARQPEAPAAEDLSISTNPAQPAAPEAVTETLDASPSAEDEEVAALPEDDAAEPEVEAAPEVVVVEPEPEVAPEPQEDAAEAEPAPSGPTVGQGSSDLSQLAPEIQTGRLPSVGGASNADAPPPPLVAFAEAPARAPDKPLMSIVLIDDGTTPLGLDALEAFPYPLTFAVDTEWSGAAEAMRTYRDAGFEVMALANLPQGAQASDVEVSLRAAIETVPEAVAVLEGDRGGLQANRDISAQVTDILTGSGHGLVLYPKGLNTTVSVAQRAGVKAQALFRDFDGQGQNATVIRRFLDQAAFKAGQEGAVIMLGRLRADTISALLIWGLQDRASRVSLVPVSTVLTTQE